MRSSSSLRKTSGPNSSGLLSGSSYFRRQTAILPSFLSPRLYYGEAVSSRQERKRINSCSVARRSLLSAAVGMTLASAVPIAASNGGVSESSAPKPTVGFLGMGTLGVPMASNLLKAGYSVTVWNRNVSKCKPLKELGAEVASSAKECTRACDITFACVSDPEAALEVATGNNGAAAGMSEGKGYIDVSTIDVGSARAIAATVHSYGGLYIEAPVSGSKGPAEQGTLVFLTAGDRQLFERAAPLLDVMGKKSFFLGADVGAGAKMKLVINMVMGSMMASFAEGLALAESSGLRQKDLLDAIGLGAIAAPMFALKSAQVKGLGWMCKQLMCKQGPPMTEGNFPPAFPLKHQQKDLRLAVELAAQSGQSVPIASASNAAYLKAVNEGLGDMDFSAILASLKEH